MRRRTWMAILLAGCGIAWMYAAGFDGDPKQLVGTAVAMCLVRVSSSVGSFGSASSL